MTPGQLADLIVTIVVGALVGLIGYLVKGDVEDLKQDVAGVRRTADEHTVSIARLVESQRAMVANQTTQSRSQEKLIEETEELEDVIGQLQDATRNLRERMERHVRFHEQLGLTTRE